MSEADDTAKDRAAVIHSSWNGFIQSNPLTMKAIHRQYRSGKILHRIYEFELKEIEEIVLTINLLNTRILPILFKATQLSQVQNKAEADLPPGAGTS